MARLNKVKSQIWTFQKGASRRRKTDYLATEEPLEIRLRTAHEQETIAITMRTPGNDYELALGFLYNEGLIQRRSEVEQITYCVGGGPESQEYNVLDVQLKRDRLPTLDQLQRHFFVNSACGVCGSTMLDDLRERNLPPLPAGPQVKPEILLSLPGKLRKAQRLFEATGGLHAAALFDDQANLLALREDVGRHNALDKLIGWGVRNDRLPFHQQIVQVSGRASYELMQKCFVAGGGLFCAVSAASSLAVELAQLFGITLVGFLRDDRFNIYSHPERIENTLGE